jgi:prepilin-type processing-associated H-X9-DG protein
MNRTDRNYGFTDGHAVTLMQRAEEGYATCVGIGNVWNNSPNGYF